MNDADESVLSTESDEGELLNGKRRTVMKAAVGAIGASVGGSAVMGSAAAAPGDTGPFQVDFVFKHGIKNPLDSTGYAGDTSGDTPSQGRLIRWLWSDQNQNENEGSLTKYNSFTDDRIGCDVSTTGSPNVDYAAGTVTQEFTIQNCTPSDWDPDGLDYPLAVYTYVAPDGQNGWDPTKASQQRLYHESRPRFSSTGTHTITADIPYLDTSSGFGVDLGYAAKAPGPHTYNNGLTAEERDGVTFEAGTEYDGGRSDQNSTYGTDFLKADSEVDAGNIDGEIYLTGHLDEGVNYYFFLQSGDYDIIFHLNELRKVNADARIFDIQIDGSAPSNSFKWTDIDLFDENDQNGDGYGQPDRRWVNSHTVTDNILNISPVSKTDKALICGIEIHDAGNNPYD
jgi:hypothetical protein